jgi:hypothetical protein
MSRKRLDNTARKERKARRKFFSRTVGSANQGQTENQLIHALFFFVAGNESNL